jgi:hypothetical protein
MKDRLVLALATLGIVHFPVGAFSESPASHCIFTSPASFACPSEIGPAAHSITTTLSMQVAATDHCVATSPASSTCPAAHNADLSKTRIVVAAKVSSSTTRQ